MRANVQQGLDGSQWTARPLGEQLRRSGRDGGSNEPQEGVT